MCTRISCVVTRDSLPRGEGRGGEFTACSCHSGPQYFWRMAGSEKVRKQTGPIHTCGREALTRELGRGWLGGSFVWGKVCSLLSSGDLSIIEHGGARRGCRRVSCLVVLCVAPV